jgi:hypothetical protein
MSEVARAVIFGRDADAFDRHRPSYPPEAMAHIIGLVDARAGVEVGVRIRLLEDLERAALDRGGPVTVDHRTRVGRGRT